MTDVPPTEGLVTLDVEAPAVAFAEAVNDEIRPELIEMKKKDYTCVIIEDDNLHDKLQNLPGTIYAV